LEEHLTFRGEPIPDLPSSSTPTAASIKAAMRSYMEMFGKQDALKHPELPLLRMLYDDVLYRDIATCHQIEAATALREVAFYLISNPANLVSYYKLQEQLNRQ
jgi:uncharacterized protein